jgi:hypothetical protein
VLEVLQAPTAAPTQDDVHARRLLQCAQGAFQKWPEGFRGFSAAIRCGDGHGHAVGAARVFGGGRVELDVEPGPLADWAARSLAALSLARTPRFFKDGDGRYAVTFEPEDAHPLGRGIRVHLGDGAWRGYRVDPKGRIRQREQADPTRRRTATYDTLVRACPGRVLPSRVQILDWDVTAQTVVETAEIEDAHERHDHAWLPLCRRTTVMQAGTRSELVLELSGHTLL